MMKAKSRWLALLLALALTLSLVTPAWAAEDETDSDTTTDTDGDTEGEDPDENPGDTTPANGVTDFQLRGDQRLENIGGSTFAITLDPDEDGSRLTVALEPDSEANRERHVAWASADSSVLDVEEVSNGHIGHLIPVAPGKTTVTITAGDVIKTINVTVSGIKLGEKLLEGIRIKENESVTITPGKLEEGADIEYFGTAEAAYPSGTGNATLTAAVVNNKNSIRVLPAGDRSNIVVEAVREDTAAVIVTVTAGGKRYSAEFSVTVTPNSSIINYTAGASTDEPLDFSLLEQEIAAQCSTMTGETLSSVTGLTVSTAQGTLYLGYKSAEDTGAGVASAGTYYVRSGARGPYLSDITFVPNPTFAGEQAVISYTGTASNGRTFKGEIRVTIKDTKTDVAITAEGGKPVQLSGTLFNKVCQSQLGSPLGYVVFTLPPASEGVLYRDYKSELDYAAQVSSSEQYSQSALGEITFVPAAGFVGTVHIGYAGYSVSGGKYNGELVINVTQNADTTVQYNDNGRGSVTFDRGSFDSYSLAAAGARLSQISFTPPPSSQGTLYNSWRNGRGITVASGDVFYYDTIGYVTFVAAADFHGTVRIPFTGTASNGREFSGTVEIHIQSTGAGDISYTCAPGASVRMEVSDFENMSQRLTGSKLHYVSFQTLPDFTLGTLYHNRTSSGSIGTRVTTTTKYFQSATPYLTNISFWATEKFRGSVEIPFTGCSVSGQTFTGILSISSTSGGSSSGSNSTTGSSSLISYTTSGQQAVTFRMDDFESACKSQANSSLNYVRFTLPSSSQGILYFNYQAGETPVSVSASDSYYRAGEKSVSKVSFHPAYGFSDVVSIPFTAWAINGVEVRGTVEVTVWASGGTGTMVQYATYAAPVRFQASDFLAAAGGNQPVSLRLTELPDASMGRLYYQYVSPTRYSWQANTTTEYSLSGDPLVSNLTFVPRAGFTGVVNIPYTATNRDGSTYTGKLRVTVEPSYTSRSFNDMAGFSSQILAAVDYLSGQGVVNGMSTGVYGPSQPIRRGDFCLMLCRAFQFDASTGTARYFTDVSSTAYYAQAVSTLSALGIVNGTGNNQFMPSASISRQDAALMIQRTLNAANRSAGAGTAQDLNAYSDGGQVGSYAQGAVAGLLQLGIFPTSGGLLAPGEDLTRADMALMLHRAMTQ